MKTLLGVGAATGLLIFAVQAQGGQDASGSPDPQAPALAWSELAPAIAGPRAGPAAHPASAPAGEDPLPELDVVDAHWMALTMWGEARGEGEEAMRAVGHVIDNRRRASRADPGFVTDTVSEAFQFSCWNVGDPNREAMLEIDALHGDGHDWRMWVVAQRIAGEILSGRSADPTGGALFYHSVDVAPRWSQGVMPVRQIGNHLFFLRSSNA
jgi:spore germination cell wall hydrolase CwlJ-like protein